MDSRVRAFLDPCVPNPYSCYPCGCYDPDPAAMLAQNLEKIRQEREIQLMKEKLEPAENVLQHEAICTELNALYARKNADYGDAFHLSYLEEGLAMSRIRIGDKFLRFKNLSRLGAFNSERQQVTDESIRDTLIDLANYAIMTVMEMDREAKERRDAEYEEYKE